ncbi:hypothetical protein PENTCL1PPCAC_13805, partial [Pristionchus entomophagus]
FFSLLAPSHAQNIVQLSRFVQEQSEHNHLAHLSETNQFFSLEDFLDVVDADEGDSLSTNCAEDLRALISARL